MTIKRVLTLVSIPVLLFVAFLIGLAVWVSGGSGQNASDFIPEELDNTPYRTYEAVVPDSPLTLRHFVSELEEINVSSSMIMGEREMVLVATQATKLAAERLADEIEKTGLNLSIVYLGHAHLDHSQGASVLKRRFPKARFLAAPRVSELQKLRMGSDDERAIGRFGDNAAVPSVPFEPLDSKVIMLEGREIQLWHDHYGDVGLGHHDEPHTVVYIPDLKALLPNDILYYDAHIMMGGSTPENRAKWKAQIREWMKMDIAVAIPGHVPRKSTAHMTPKGVFEHSLNYIEAYEEALASSETSEQVINKMLQRYPGMEHTSALYMGTYINFQEIHKLMNNPRLELVASYLPSDFVRWADQQLFEASKDAANPH
ncbi:MBL fold metallo-hydrolase [Alterisphingorhabdus coralli]|uniref:MBL fold metallo-hydrolase n=1 Tax=Alterisphingorhabdus coralli TaxID=3071408 RepID=A0AA97HZH5_9SPHN|nr:MBL fold metallo-hydrolase [Parasphingorhabdus sp. SCSIO 66989]WOE74674.1 MBL fold metallo-hydrolase [Parasphingorhabdus sp. SCSIO 66989]